MLYKDNVLFYFPPSLPLLFPYFSIPYDIYATRRINRITFDIKDHLQSIFLNN